MIEREIAEALFPDFVRKFDAELAEVNAYCRELCDTTIKKSYRKQPNQFTEEGLRARNFLLEVLDRRGPIKLGEIMNEVGTKWAYHTVNNNLRMMMEEGLVIRPAYAVYDVHANYVKRGTLAGEN